EAHALIERLSARLAEKEEALAQRDEEIEQLEAKLEKLIRRQFGKSSEKLSEEQLALCFEDLETGIAAARAKAESSNLTLKAKRQSSKRGRLPDTIARVEILVDVEHKTCPCCGGELHVIGEDKSERLDTIPAQHRVLVTRRPKYGCRACGDGVVQVHG